MRRLIAGVAGAALALSLAACGGSSSGAGDKGTIGVAMPTKSSERWIADGNNIKKQLEAAGYKVDLQYAEDDIPTQVSQVENMVTKGEKMLVIAAIDGTALGDVLSTAKDSNIPVISYDRLIRDTDAVDYYTTFDNEKVGVLQAQSLVDGLKASGAKAPYNVELFAGSPDDNNATFFWNGAMSVLKPMIDSGDIKVVSGQTKFEQAAILRWDPATAQKRMEDILTKSYTQETVNGVLSPYDGLSLGIIAALKANGYSGGGKQLPVVTGQDAEVQSVKSILAGEQYSTIFKDTRKLAKVTVAMVKAIAADKKPEVNDTKTYDNGKKVVPSYLLDPVPVTKDDVTKALVDTGLLHPGRAQVTRAVGAPVESTVLPGHPRTTATAPRRREKGPMSQPILEMRSITKEFPGVKALSDVSLTVKRGDIHAICGENGAGKSTLMKVLSGVYPHGSYTGDIVFDGQVVEFKNIRQSEAAGIVIIHQELALIPELSIAENIFLGNETASGGVISWDRANRQAIELLARVGLAENPLTQVKHLGVGKQQLVEIAKALSKEVKLLILDEPTAALNDDDSQHLLDLLKGLQGKGITSIMISHKLNEIEQIADEITIIRDGRTIETLAVAEDAVDEDRIIRGMVGRDLEHRFPEHEPEIGDVLFEVSRLDRDAPAGRLARGHQERQPDGAPRRDRRHRRPDGRRPHRARPQHLRPLLRQQVEGRLVLDGKELHLGSVPAAIDAGIAYLTEDRKALGLNLARRHQALDHLGRPVQAPQGADGRPARGGRGRREVPHQHEHQDADRERGRRQAVGGQPAEGRAEQVDVHRPAAADPRRADARHRRRREVRDLRRDPAPGQAGPRRARDLLGAARAARALRPHLHPRRGPHHPRVQSRRGRARSP